MISVENFYWMLYENLLRPVDLGIRYCYPFGTTDSVVKFEYENCLNNRYEANVFFHFDQEPIYDSDHPVFIDDANRKFARVLANSEISGIKKNLCQRHQFLDWYFFYHGFASLYWFEAAKFIDRQEDVVYPFCSFNHLFKEKRSYRMALTARLANLGLLKKGCVSFHGSFENCKIEIDNVNSQLSDRDRYLIEKNIVALKMQPMILDSREIDGSFSAKFGIHEYRMHQRSFLHVVNETVFYDAKQHLTEKIFKPIVSLRPFILVGAPYNLQYLKTYGFQTFDKWIDESYDTIVDPSARLDHITHEIDRISTLSRASRTDMLEDMRATLEHNKRHFFSRFREIIVEELVDNFDRCLRIWNNGRIDDRRLPAHPNLHKAKHILLR